ncbi:MAG TPA: methionine--tRNA ligase [Patescibacteria group bacterium]|nr:methionine--tRNA ligase [Patescibacteria group bacterium]
MTKDRIPVQEFQRVEMRVGRILDAEKVDRSDKLIKLLVDIGGEVRQIVAGLGETYAVEELKEKKIVIVVNLEKKELMGEVSDGMILAADDPHGPVFLTPSSDVPEGTIVR